MLGINRESVLKNFLDKVKDAKRLQMKDVKMTMKEMDDLAYIIYQLMAEEISKSLDKLQVKTEEPKINKPINRRVLEEIKIVKKHEEEPNKQVVEEIREEPKVIEEPIKEEVVEEDEETEVDDNSLYGGSW